MGHFGSFRVLLQTVYVCVYTEQQDFSDDVFLGESFGSKVILDVGCRAGSTGISLKKSGFQEIDGCRPCTWNGKRSTWLGNLPWALNWKNRKGRRNELRRLDIRCHLLHRLLQSRSYPAQIRHPRALEIAEERGCSSLYCSILIGQGWSFQRSSAFPPVEATGDFEIGESILSSSRWRSRWLSRVRYQEVKIRLTLYNCRWQIYSSWHLLAYSWALQEKYKKK